MHPSENDAFGKLLIGVMEVYSRPAPSAQAMAAWWLALKPYPFDVVSRAFSAHMAAERFPPAPAHVLALLGQGGGDGRPAADEAWATALASRDEADTVVWTEETAQAFAACRPVLALGDEVGARMAFKAAYDRLVAAARREHRPTAWQVSLGWDQERRQKVVASAVQQGLLPAPAAAALLQPPEPEPGSADAAAARVQTQRILAMLTGPTPSQRREQARAAAAEAERARLAALKAQTATRVAQHQERQP